MRWVLALLALLVLALLWMWGTSSGPSAEPLAPMAPERSRGEAEVAAVASPIALEAESRASPAVEGPDVPAATSTAGVTPRSLEVRVTQPGGTAAAGAEVFLLDEQVRHPGTGAVEPFGGIDEELEAFALRVVADAEGRAGLPTPLGRSKLAARQGDGFALEELDGGEPGPIALELGPDPPVRVRVVGEDGRPVAGVPVALCYAKRHWQCVRAITDAQGIAEVRARDRAAKLRESGALVSLAIPAREPVEAPVDLEHPPAEPIELRLPATGSLVVLLVDPRGELRSERALVGVDLAPRTEAEIGGAAARIHEAWMLTEDGRALIEFVGLGLELSVQCDSEDLFLVDRVTGPRTAGERVELRIPAGEPLHSVRGRIVDAERDPIGPARLSILAWSEKGDFAAETVTDAEGRFVARLRFDPPVERMELETSFPLGEEAFGELIAPRSAAPGETDLGDVVLERTPLVVAGTVRSTGGEPLRRASIALTLPESSSNPDPMGEFGRLLGGPRGSTDALGRFEIRDRLPPGTTHVELRAAKAGHLPSRLPAVAVGSSGLEIELQPAGSISGRLRAGDPRPKFQLFASGTRLSVGTNIDGDGFRFEPLPPGMVTLVARFEGSDAQLEIPGIAVVAGEETRDPRLDPLDLSSLLSTVSLRIEDEDGRPVRDAKVFQRPPGSETYQSCNQRLVDERCVITTGVFPLQLLVEADGFRSVELADVDSDRSVTLRRGIPVRIALVGALPDLPPGWTLGGVLQAAASKRVRRIGWGPPRAPSVEFDWDPVAAEVLLPEPGSFSLTPRVVQRHAGKTLTAFDLGGSAPDVAGARIEVADRDELQVFEVALPPGALETFGKVIERSD